MGKARHPTRSKREQTPAGRRQALLVRAVEIYEQALWDSDEALAFLEGQGLRDDPLLVRLRVGYSAGRLSNLLPRRGGVRRDLVAAGVLDDEGRERLDGCVVFPVVDAQGDVVTLWGIRVDGADSDHLIRLGDGDEALWNAEAARTHPTVLVVGSMLDALSLHVAGCGNTVAFGDPGWVCAGAFEQLAGKGLSELTFLLGPSDIAAGVRDQLPQAVPACLSYRVVILGVDGQLSQALTDAGPEALAATIRDLLATAKEDDRGPCGADAPSGQTPECGQARGTPGIGGESLRLNLGLLQYRVFGLEARDRRLKATIRAENGGRLHIDTLDLYNARARRMLCRDLCRSFGLRPEQIEAEIAKLTVACETFSRRATPAAADAPLVMTPEDRTEAESFGRSADLLDRIVADYETCGLVGEHHNKLLCYLAAVSRKTTEPLSVLILSSSGAGKSALQETTLRLCPPEDVVKLTNLTAKALFYRDSTSLRHKILAVEEGAGAEDAGYAVRNLISAGELVSSATVRDRGTGRLTVMENRVEGPTAVFLTTTNPDVDAETRSRFVVASVDEGQAQTRAILEYQRRRRTFGGLTDHAAVTAVMRRHHSFQRLLRPVMVVNPYAPQLAYIDSRLQGRREQPKYLGLINTVAFLRQMQKQIRKRDGVELIEVEPADIAVANDLAMVVLGRSMDELSRPARDLMGILDALVDARLEELRGAGAAVMPMRRSVGFTRRDVREFCGWAHARLHRYIRELLRLEYVRMEALRGGTLHYYRLTDEHPSARAERSALALQSIDVAGTASSEIASARSPLVPHVEADRNGESDL